MRKADLLDDRRGHDRTAARGLIEQAHRQLHHPHAVGDRVVAAQDHRTALKVVLDPDRLPQWAIAIEHLTPVGCDEVLQRAGIARIRQRNQRNVVVDVEVLVGLPPPGAVSILDRDAAKNRVAVEESFLDHGPHLGEVQGFGRPDHRVDHHEVVRPVHLQPQGVLYLKSASSFHRHLSSGPRFALIVVDRRTTGSKSGFSDDCRLR